MASLRVALAQMRCEKGDIDLNLATTARYLEDATRMGADVVCLPEASLTGYVNERQHPGTAVRLDGPEVARLVALTLDTSTTLIAGIVEAHPSGPSHPPYLTQLVAREGQLCCVYRKRTIPDEEADLYTAGDEPATFDLAGIRGGLAICADISAPAVFADCADAGARVIFECAAPGLYGAQETRDWASGYTWWRGECYTNLSRYAREHGVYVAVSTQAGRTRDEDFPGGGYLFGLDGACLAESDDWSEGVLDVSISLS